VVSASAACLATAAQATPYASGVQVEGQTVNFFLNEPADSLRVSINNGASFLTLDGSTTGAKSFAVPSSNTPFSIVASKSAGPGYLQGAALRVVPDSVNTRFNAPRGVAVNQNPNNAAFGRIYVSNANVGSLTTGITRSNLTRGFYLLNADGSSAVGQGDTARAGTFGPVFDASTAGLSPFRVEVGPDNNLYAGDSGGSTTANGGLYRFGPSVGATDGEEVLFGRGYDSAATINNNQHGRITASPVVVPSATPGNLTLYAIDGDLNTPANTLNSLRQYTIGATGSAAAPITPTLINTGASGDPANPGFFGNVANVTTDLARGKDGKYYMMQNRSVGNEAGLLVISSDGSSVLFNSLATTKALGADGDTVTAGTQDLLRQVRGEAISPDGSRIALIRDDNAIFIIPLIDGIPDLANRTLISGTAAFGTATTLGRDIGFDAAGNLYAVSSGAGLLRILSPGGFSEATTSYDGSTLSFAVVPEPAAAGLLAGCAAAGLLRRGRRRQR
jgi:hypothetical protein